MQPSTLVFICLCGSRALRPPSPVFTQRRRCSHSATPRGFGGTTKKTKKAKREGRERADGRGRRAERCSYSVGVPQLDAEEALALGLWAAAVGWERATPAALAFCFLRLLRRATEATRRGAVAASTALCDDWWSKGSTAAEADEE